MTPNATEVLPLPARAEPALASPVAPVSSAPPCRTLPAPLWQSRHQRSGNRRIWRLSLGTGLLALLSGGFLWLSALFAPPRGVEFVLIGAAYEQNLSVPDNVYGWNSLTDLANAVDSSRQHSMWTRRFRRLRSDPKRLLTDTRLADLAPQSRARNWVLFVSAHGVCNQQGAYLIAENDLDPAQPAPRITLPQILDHVRTLPAEQHKIVVLDVAHMQSDLPRGMLINDFAVELARQEAAITAIPNLVVVCASNTDELSWPCPMWGRSTFAHFWIEGLRGAAEDEDASGRISLAELMNFVAGQTNHWVSQYYHAQQTPWLLPSGKEGEHRAKQMDLAWKDQAYEPSTPTLTCPTSVPAELRQAWQQARELSLRPVPPYVYQPQTWRRYLTTLARYERLLLAGDAHAAERLGVEVQSLAVRCEHDPTQLLSSLDAQRSSRAFDNPATPELRSRGQDILQLLSRTPVDQWNETWKQLLTQAGDDGKPLRAEVMQLLVDQVINDPIQRLTPARQLANILRDPIQPLSPALHLIVMMERDLPAEARVQQAAPLLAQAIRVRQLAEQASTGDLVGFTQSSPRVRPWVMQHITNADRLRQQAEDLLFASTARHGQAQDLLTQAESIYRQAISDGGHVLQAYAARDRAFALLPDVSVSVIYSPYESVDPLTTKELSAQLAAAWNEAQQLTDSLAKADQADTIRTMLDLNGSTQRTTDALARIEQQLLQIWIAHTSDQAGGERLFFSLSPSSPSMDVETRAAAWNRSLQYVHRRREDLNQLLILSATGYSYEPIAVQESRRDILAVQNVAQEHAQLALAMLGPRNFTRAKLKSSDTWPEVWHRLEVFRVDPNWRTALATIAQQMSLRWRQMPATIADIADHPNNEARSNTSCIVADDLARNLLPQFFTSLNDKASDDLRRRRLSSYLAWQAERTWHDHWYGERPDETPYYAARARALLADAQQVSPQPNAFQSLAQRIATDDDWNLETPDGAAVTREEKLKLNSRLLPMRQELLAGYVSMRYDIGSGLRVTAPLLDAIVWSPNHAAVDIPLQAVVTDDALASHQTVLPTTIGISGYYRGREIRRQVAVKLHSTPDFAVFDPTAPTTGMVALEVAPELARQFGQGQGALAIVLDCSGSMGPKAGQPFDASTRYAQATTALTQVLAGIPRGTQLSLWTFGEATGPQKTIKDAEKTIRCIRPLASWDPNDQTAHQALIKSFTYPTVEPWNESAVVHAMLSAKEDLVKAVGSKTLVVITDGIDNRFEQDRQINPRSLDVATGISEAFRGSGISVNFVGFQIASHEEQAARKQFLVIETLNPPGQFYSVTESSELVAALDGALDRRLRYWVEDYDHRPVAGETTAGWSPSLTTSPLPRDRGQVPSGEYLLRLSAGKPMQRAITIAGGDLLLTQMNSTGGAITIQRGSVLDRLYTPTQRQHCGVWNAGVLQSGLAADRALVTIALERDYDPTELVLGQPTPPNVWWEFTLDGIDAAMRATRTYDVGLPAWRLECLPPAADTLPAATTGVLSGWWLEAGVALSNTQLVAGRDFRNIDELLDREVNVDGECLTIRDARWEESSRGRQLVLVMEGSPLESTFARISGIGEVVAEHRHYESLARYVGIFEWPTNAPVDAGYRIEFGSVASLKRAAEERGTHVRFDKLLLQRTSSASQP